MRILYVLNGLGFSTGMPIGGADKRALEIGRRLEARAGVEVSVLTTQAGYNVLQKNGWDPKALITSQPSFWPSRWFKTLLGRLISYFYLTFFGFKPDPLDYDLIYPTSDFFFDLLPAVRVKLGGIWRGKKKRLVGIVHHFIDWPWKRSGPFAANLALFLSQRFGFILLSQFADLVLLADTGEGRKIARAIRHYGVPVGKIDYFRNGVDYRMIERVPTPAKTYQACIVGGIRPSKGVFDIVPVWIEILKKLPEAKLLVIGGGAQEYVEKLRLQVTESGLLEKIELAGVVPQEDLYSKIKSAEVFVSPSREEGWGIVLCEAFACGLPVVCYDLPAFEMFEGGLVKVELGNTASLATEIIRLLTDRFVRSTLARDALEEGRKWGWGAAERREYEQLAKISNSPEPRSFRKNLSY